MVNNLWKNLQWIFLKKKGGGVVSKAVWRFSKKIIQYWGDRPPLVMSLYTSSQRLHQRWLRPQVEPGILAPCNLTVRPRDVRHIIICLICAASTKNRNCFSLQKFTWNLSKKPKTNSSCVKSSLRGNSINLWKDEGAESYEQKLANVGHVLQWSFQRKFQFLKKSAFSFPFVIYLC